MTNIARLMATAGLFTFATLAACASPSADETATDVSPVTDPAANDEASDQAGEEDSDDGQGSNLPAHAFRQLVRPPGCTVQVDAKRALMITDVSVVEDAVRTRWSGSLANPSDGAWHFGRLMTNMAGDKDAPAFVERLLHRWEKDRPVNGWNVAARPSFASVVTDAWPKTADGHIDLTKAPLRLLAIVNRMDLRDLSKGSAGEGRFVFGVLDGNGDPLQFTLILEYRLPGTTDADVKAWTGLWGDLQSSKLGSAAYRTALQKVTDKFSGKNAAPGRPNGSAINQIRTNEIAFGPEWELREFRLSTKTGNIYSATVKQTPDITLDGSKLLGEWINTHEKEILDGTSWVTETTSKQAFRAGSALTPFFFAWNPPGVKNPEARHLFSLNTCNGCHAGETQTTFLHVNPRSKGQEAQLSGFLTGETINDPITGKQRKFGDLARRGEDFAALLCTR